ncbi:34785_t:CDS:2, partial [Gigaspora margarita]
MPVETLFSSDLISSEVQAALPKGHTIRPLSSEDYEKGFLDVLTVLTTVGDMSKAQFLGKSKVNAKERFYYLKAHNHEYFTLVIVSPEDRIIGAGTIFIERKFIHNNGLVGHIEDIAVDKNQQGKKLGLRIIQALKHIGAKTGCYKDKARFWARNNVEGLVNVDGPIVDVDGPIVDEDGPIVDVDGPIVDVDGPIVDVDGPIVDVDGPI